MENTATSLFDGVAENEYEAMLVCFKTVTVSKGDVVVFGYGALCFRQV